MNRESRLIDEILNISTGLYGIIIVNSKNKKTLAPLGFDPDLSGLVGAVSNRTGLECLINSKVHYSI